MPAENSITRLQDRCYQTLEHMTRGNRVASVRVDHSKATPSNSTHQPIRIPQTNPTISLPPSTPSTPKEPPALTSPTPPKAPNQTPHPPHSPQKPILPHPTIRIHNTLTNPQLSKRITSIKTHTKPLHPHPHLRRRRLCCLQKTLRPRICCHERDAHAGTAGCGVVGAGLDAGTEVEGGEGAEVVEGVVGGALDFVGGALGGGEGGAGGGGAGGAGVGGDGGG